MSLESLQTDSRAVGLLAIKHTTNTNWLEQHKDACTGHGYQVHDRQLEAAASTADSTVHTADAAKEYAPLQRAEGARTGPEKTPREPQDRGHGPIDAAARPRMCMRLRGGGQSEVLRVIRKNVDGVSSNVARFNTLCQQIKTENAHKPILAVCLQEHHLTCPSGATGGHAALGVRCRWHQVAHPHGGGGRRTVRVSA